MPNNLLKPILITVGATMSFLYVLAVTLSVMEQDPVQLPDMHAWVIVEGIEKTSGGLYRYKVVNSRRQYTYNAFGAESKDNPKNTYYLYLTHNKYLLGDTLSFLRKR
jgi:hypothetical protein